MKIKFLFGMTMFSLGVTGLMTGCEIDSAENSTRNPGLTVEGFYTGRDGGPMVPRTTGNQVQTMNLTQNGDQLQVIDDNGIIFRGSLGQVIDDGATFTLRGQATSGQEATISGNFDVAGTMSTMRGSWIEDSLVSTVFGEATVPENTTPAPTNDNPNVANVTISPGSAITLNSGAAQTFTASGGTGTFRWAQSPVTLGELAFSGDRDRIAQFVAGNMEGDTSTLTVSDQNGGANADSASVQITIAPSTP